MKKYLLILSLLFTPFLLQSQRGSFKNYSLFYGAHYIPKHGFSKHFEIQYDTKEPFTCRRINYPKYFGFGLSATFYEKGEEYGLKYAYNPFKFYLRVTRKSLLTPYLYLQGNVKLLYETIEKDYNLRPGIGFTYYRRRQGILPFSIRSSLQFGYNLDNKPSLGDSFIMEFKIGIGFNYWRFRRKRSRYDNVK